MSIQYRVTYPRHDGIPEHTVLIRACCASVIMVAVGDEGHRTTLQVTAKPAQLGHAGESLGPAYHHVAGKLQRVDYFEDKGDKYHA